MRIVKPVFFFTWLSLFTSLTVIAPAQAIPAEAGTWLPADTIPELEPGTETRAYSVLFFPPGDLYAPYAAAPTRIGFGIEPVRASRVTIPDTTAQRIALRAGAQLGIVRFQQLDDSGRGWQINVLGGFNDQNDTGHSLDNIGWDGHYGLVATGAASRTLAFKFGLLHVSSHLGDEYAERTGRRRIGYTRQEIAAGASWYMTERWRVYAESGWAFTMGSDLQQPWRAQAGLEYESRPFLWRARAAWYAALDSQAMQERDWRTDVSVQTGLVARSAGRTWRLGVSWYNGRPPIGEFFQYTERYLTLGLWIDV